jgi:hypothetical protein
MGGGGVTLAEIAADRPGVYGGMPAAAYLADPVPGGSLSASGARLLTPPSCPARFRWHADNNGRPPKNEFDFGHAAHKEVLGDGAPVVVVDARDWRTKAAREAKEKARADGHTPLLADDWVTVQAMAAALRRHPIAGALFEPGTGLPEQTLIWRDEETGVMRRARLDWLRDPNGGRLIIPDYKSCQSASPEAAGKALHSHGYYRQAPWYCDGATALGLAGDDEPAFLLVMQEKTAPYLVATYQPDPFAMQAGRALNRRAVDIYRRCQESGYWPGYAVPTADRVLHADRDVLPLPLPGWAEYQHAAAAERGDYDTDEDNA